MLPSYSTTNQLTGFYVRATLALNGFTLKTTKIEKNSRRLSFDKNSDLKSFETKTKHS